MNQKARDAILIGLAGERAAPGDKAALANLEIAAQLCEKEEYNFLAGWAYDQAMFSAWADAHLAEHFLRKSCENYRKCIDREPKCSFEALAALKKVVRSYMYTDVRDVQSLSQELAQRLVSCFSDTPDRGSYLVRGFILETDFSKRLSARFPAHEVDPNTEHYGQSGLQISMPGAFRTFTENSDYLAAQDIVDSCSDAFTSHSLRGWRWAIAAFLDKDGKAPELFLKASEEFAKDTLPTTDAEVIARGGGWSAENISLWSPYFRARSLVAEGIKDPRRLPEFLGEAVRAFPVDRSGIVSWKASRFASLIEALHRILADGSPASIGAARKNFQRSVRHSAEDQGDPWALRFLNLAEEALDGFSVDPRKELFLGRLPEAMEALSRVQLVGDGLAKAAEPHVGNTVLKILEGPVRTWMHRALGAIKDERKLQKVILRICQAALPLYAQVLHGPLEYGKDVVALIRKDGKTTLLMFQVKVEDIKTEEWRKARQEMEEMFQAPLSKFQLPEDPSKKKGILVCNGHAHPQVLPIMEGWFQEQRNIHKRDVEFWHLDLLVNWIADEKRISELRQALLEIGIAPTAQSQ